MRGSAGGSKDPPLHCPHPTGSEESSSGRGSGRPEGRPYDSVIESKKCAAGGRVAAPYVGGRAVNGWGNGLADTPGRIPARSAFGRPEGRPYVHHAPPAGRGVIEWGEAEGFNTKPEEQSVVNAAKLQKLLGLEKMRK